MNISAPFLFRYHDMSESGLKAGHLDRVNFVPFWDSF
jgi:hypothetical protein